MYAREAFCGGHAGYPSFGLTGQRVSPGITSVSDKCECEERAFHTHTSQLLGVQFDDELLVDWQRNFIALRQRNDLARKVGKVDLKP